MATKVGGDAESAGRSKGANERPRRGRHNRESEILDAAIGIFWRKGYSVATIQDIADAVGILKGSVYYYIDSKEDLLFSIFERAHGEAMKIVEDVRALDAPPLERLQVYFERYVEYFLHNLEQASLYLREWRSLNKERYQVVLDQRRMYDEFVIGLIHEAQARGEVDPSHEAKYAAYFILGAIKGLPDWYRREGQDSAPTIARVYAAQSLAMLTGGIEQNR